MILSVFSSFSSLGCCIFLKQNQKEKNKKEVTEISESLVLSKLREILQEKSQQEKQKSSGGGADGT